MGSFFTAGVCLGRARCALRARCSFVPSPFPHTGLKPIVVIFGEYSLPISTSHKSHHPRLADNFVCISSLAVCNLTSVCNLFCCRFGAVAADGYGLGYNIDGELITIPITAFRGGDTDGQLTAKELERALREIGDVCR